MRKRENLVDLEKSEKNAPFLAIAAVHTAENEQYEVCVKVFVSVRSSAFKPARTARAGRERAHAEDERAAGQLREARHQGAQHLQNGSGCMFSQVSKRILAQNVFHEFVSDRL